MIFKRYVLIVLLLSFMIPAMPIYAEESIIAVSQASEGQLLSVEGLLVVIDKEEFKQFIRDATLAEVCTAVPLIMSAVVTVAMLISTYWVMSDLRAIRRVIS